MEKKDSMIVILSVLLVFMLVFNVSMAYVTRRNIDKCNSHWKQQLLDNNCVELVDSQEQYGFVDYDTPNYTVTEDVDGPIKWK